LVTKNKKRLIFTSGSKLAPGRTSPPVTRAAVSNDVPIAMEDIPEMEKDPRGSGTDTSSPSEESFETMDFVEDSSEEGESSEEGDSTPPSSPEVIDLVSTSSDSVDNLSALYGEMSPYNSGDDDEPGKCQACAMLTAVTKAKSFP